MNALVKSFLILTSMVFGMTALAAERLSEQETTELSTFGAKVFGIRWAGPLVGANERDVIAVSDGVTTLTMRKGSRTYIVHNSKFTSAGERMQFTGTDADLRRVGMRILLGAGADRRQVAEVRILQQLTQAAEVDPTGGGPKFLPMRRGMRSLMITRQIDGIPVLSSRMMLDLDHAGRVAFMELNWPDISPDVIERARQLRKVASGRFEAPSMEGASVESIQASILHSPAVGFYNDATAAIRVIYRPDSKNVGQKPVRYVDANGNDVAQPRDIDAPREEPVKRSPSDR